VCGEADKERGGGGDGPYSSGTTSVEAAQHAEQSLQTLRQMYRLPSRSPQRPPPNLVFCYRSERVDRDCEEVSIHECAFVNRVEAKEEQDKIAYFLGMITSSPPVDRERRRQTQEKGGGIHNLPSAAARAVGAAGRGGRGRSQQLGGLSPQAGSLRLGPPKAHLRYLKVWLYKTNSHEPGTRPRMSIRRITWRQSQGHLLLHFQSENNVR
jgi:hypothetical protein